jgi:hypothetical protein
MPVRCSPCSSARIHADDREHQAGARRGRRRGLALRPVAPRRRSALGDSGHAAAAPTAGGAEPRQREKVALRGVDQAVLSSGRNEERARTDPSSGRRCRRTIRVRLVTTGPKARRQTERSSASCITAANRSCLMLIAPRSSSRHATWPLSATLIVAAAGSPVSRSTGSSNDSAPSGWASRRRAVRPVRDGPWSRPGRDDRP